MRTEAGAAGPRRRHAPWRRSLASVLGALVVGVVSVAVAPEIGVHKAAAAAAPCCVPLLSGPYDAAVRASTPLSYWRLDKTSGDGTDEMGAANALSTNVCASCDGQTGALLNDSNTAIDFDGSSFIELDATKIPKPAAAFSLEAWFETTATAGVGYIAGWGQYAGGQAGEGLYLNNGQLGGFAVTGCGCTRVTVTTPSSYADGAWHYAVLSYDGAHLALYVDTVQRVQAAASGSVQYQLVDPFSEPMISGDGAIPTPNNMFVGGIDEVALYGAPLSTQDMDTHWMASGRTLSPAGAPITAGEVSGPDNPAVRNRCTVCETQPVNPLTGNLVHAFTDVSVAGRGLSVAMSRTYNSDAAAAGATGPLGPGWSFSYGPTLVVNGDGSVTITQEDGAQVKFSAPSGSTYAPAAPRTDATLSDNGSAFVFTRQHKTVFTFSLSGQLVSEADPNGYTTALHYTGTELTSVVAATDSGSAATRTLTFAYGDSAHPNNITAVSDGVRSPVHYAYDPLTGDLTTVTDLNGGITTLGYANHLLTTIVQPQYASNNSVPPLTYAYDTAVPPRVTSITDESSHATVYDWAPNLAAPFSANLSPVTLSGAMTITDPNANVTTDSFAAGELIDQVTGYGSAQQACWRYTYDPETLGPTSITDPDGVTTVMTYDADGDVLARTVDPAGLDRTTRYTYNGLDNLTSVQDARSVAYQRRTGSPGFVTTFDYYPASSTSLGPYPGGLDLADVKTPLWDANNTPVLDATTPVVRQVSYGRFGSGDTNPADVTAITDPDGGNWGATYDGFGDLTAVTSPPSGTDQTPAGADTTVYCYDAVGRADEEVSPRGSAGFVCPPAPPVDPTPFTTIVAHDNEGAVTSVKDPLYNSATSPTAHLRSATYDANGRLASYTDANANRTVYAYSPTNKVTSINRAVGSASPTTLSYGYDPDDNVATYTDAATPAHTTTYSHLDPAWPHVVTAVGDPDARTTSYTYDLSGNVVGRQDPGGSGACPGTGTDCATYANDHANETTSVAYSDGRTPNVGPITYDPDGQRLSMSEVGAAVSPCTTRTSTWSYDSLDRLTQAVDANCATVAYAYADASKPQGQELGAGPTTIAYPGTATGTVVRSYDPLGRLASLTDWKSNTTTFGYDSDSDPTTTAPPSTTGVSDTSAYDGAGNVSSITDANAAGTFASFAYTRDPANQVASVAPVASAGVFPDSHYYAYTPLNQVCVASPTPATSCSSPPSGSATYAYDGADNPTQVASGPPQAFDPANELCWVGSAAACTTSPAPAGVTAYGYDARGNRTTVSSAGAGPATVSATDYGYDQADRLTSLTSPAPTGVGFVQVSTSPAVASQISIDSTPADTWGADVAEPPGTHTVCFSGVQGFTTPACETVSVTAGQTTAVVGTFAQRGYLQVGTSPCCLQDAVISVDGVARDDDTVYTDVPAGAHSVCWGPVAGQTPPGCQAVTVVAGGTLTVIGDYTSTPGAGGPPATDGFLRVTTSPAVPAQITVDGVSRDSWSLDYLRIGAGSHTVCFTDIGGYTTPACETATVTSGQNTFVTGTYTQRAYLQVGTSPAVDATISVDGIARDDWGMYTDLSAGAHRVCFGDVAGYVPPPCQAVTLTAGQLSSLTGAFSPSSSYTYDGDGLRMSATVVSSTDNFAWDVSGSVPLVLADGANSYVYGPGGVPLEQIDAAGNVTWYHHDALGSTRVLTDSAGKVGPSFTYDAYGAPTGVGSPAMGYAGATTTPLGFAGAYTDAATGLVYLVNRYYDPATGLFLTRDPLTPITRSPYGYVAGDPLNHTDPVGLQELEEEGRLDAAAVAGAESLAGPATDMAGETAAAAEGEGIGAGGDVGAAEEGAIPAGSTADAATSGSRITSSVRGQYFQEGAEPPMCSYCQQNPAEHLDHVIPRSQGGDLTPENLTPACEWCNLSKGARVAPVNPPAGYVGEWPPPFWPERMTNWWYSTYGGSS